MTTKEKKMQKLSIDKKYSISVEEACEYTGISENAMYSLIKREGTKFCCRIGDRKCVREFQRKRIEIRKNCVASRKGCSMEYGNC